MCGATTSHTNIMFSCDEMTNCIPTGATAMVRKSEYDKTLFFYCICACDLREERKNGGGNSPFTSPQAKSVTVLLDIGVEGSL